MLEDLPFAKHLKNTKNELWLVSGTCHGKKTPLTFHHTGWIIWMLMMVYYSGLLQSACNCVV